MALDVTPGYDRVWLPASVVSLELTGVRVHYTGESDEYDCVLSTEFVRALAPVPKWCVEGADIEAVDVTPGYDSTWFPAKVRSVDVERQTVHVHYEGTADKFDSRVDFDQVRQRGPAPEQAAKQGTAPQPEPSGKGKRVRKASEKGAAAAGGCGAKRARLNEQIG